MVYLHEHGDVAVVGPRLREADGSINISAHPIATFGSMLGNRARRFFPFLTPLLARGKRFESYDACLHATEPTEVEMVIAACVAVRGDFLRDELGGLDEGYFMYCEDMELCLQAWQRGRRVVYLPTVEAFHEGGGSSGDRSHVWPLNTRSALRYQRNAQAPNTSASYASPCSDGSDRTGRPARASPACMGERGTDCADGPQAETSVLTCPGAPP